MKTECINYEYPECDNAFICPCLMYENHSNMTDNHSCVLDEVVLTIDRNILVQHDAEVRRQTIKDFLMKISFERLRRIMLEVNGNYTSYEGAGEVLVYLNEIAEQLKGEQND